MNAIGFDEEGLKEIIEDARIEDRNHFEALTPRIHELGGALPRDIRGFADVAGCLPAGRPPRYEGHQNDPWRGAQLWGCLLDCPRRHFQYDVRTGENHFPRNVYPEDMDALEGQVGPLKTYPVEVREGEIWVDLE